MPQESRPFLHTYITIVRRGIARGGRGELREAKSLLPPLNRCFPSLGPAANQLSLPPVWRAFSTLLLTRKMHQAPEIQRFRATQGSYPEQNTIPLRARKHDQARFVLHFLQYICEICHLCFMLSNLICCATQQSQPLLSPSWLCAADGSIAPQCGSIKLLAARWQPTIERVLRWAR